MSEVIQQQLEDLKERLDAVEKKVGGTVLR